MNPMRSNFFWIVVVAMAVIVAAMKLFGMI